MGLQQDWGGRVSLPLSKSLWVLIPVCGKLLKSFCRFGVQWLVLSVKSQQGKVSAREAMVYAFYWWFCFQRVVKESAAMGSGMGTVGFMLCSSTDACRSLALLTDTGRAEMMTRNSRAVPGAVCGWILTTVLFQPLEHHLLSRFLISWISLKPGPCTGHVGKARFAHAWSDQSHQPRGFVFFFFPS